ncbi:serine hydrolase domain-containing protein [Teichococcus oryzae]|uniref:Serine hydrolase n=1 Tax=Teichococcus oryzae TaxID=1608942 RepID=A0A5B2TLM1_9PROT|nr:serine hydrolase [Pseudoroseomonas oryzae]KAA2215109.1 serine hydrolase [Pseudoroseomonas oryzae]
MPIADPSRRRSLLGLAAASPLVLAAAPRNDGRLDPALAAAEALEPLHAVIVAQHGEVLAERRFRGPATDRPANVKSVSKSIIAALVGIAIERGHLEGTGQRIAPLLRDKLPSDPDPRLAQVTIGHLLAMRAGLERTSGSFYGSWVSSSDWVRAALGRPFVADPGGPMLYSTGNTHLLSAILTRRTGRTTLDLARDWLGNPLGIRIPPWPRDPQGIYFGGNDMLLSPHALLRFAEMIRQGGRSGGRQVVPEAWIRASWEPQAPSFFTGDFYGYGWFLRRDQAHPRFYAWGFGGQMVHVVPTLGLSIVVTSDPTQRSGGAGGHAAALHRLVEHDIIPALAG